MLFFINVITDTCQLKDKPFENKLSFETAELVFKERHEILEQFNKLKEIENNLKKYKVSIGISMGYFSEDFSLSKKS